MGNRYPGLVRPENRTKGTPWSCAISTPWSPSTRRGRSPRRPTRCGRCSRTSPTRSASSRPSSASRCSPAGRGGADARRSRAGWCWPAPGGSAASSTCCTRSSPRSRASRSGNATFGVVGTASRWLVPQLVEQLASGAPGVRLLVHEGASERLLGELVTGELALAVVTAPAEDPRLVFEHLADEPMVGLAPAATDIGEGPFSVTDLARYRLVLPPGVNPLRAEIEAAAARRGVQLDVPVEVEGIRLIADLVAAGAGIAVLPETAVPPVLDGLRTFADRRPPAAPARPGDAQERPAVARRPRRSATRCSRSSAGRRDRGV